MNHSEYQELTARLRVVTDKVRVGRNWKSYAEDFANEYGQDTPNPFSPIKYERTIDRAVKDMAGWMDARLDSFITDNQDRADRDLPATKDVETLYQAMVRFYDDANEPIPGMVGLFGPVIKRCNEWMAMVLEWFPDISPYPDKFRNMVVKSEAYKIAVYEDKIMIPPFTWIGKKKALAVWIERYFRPGPTDPVGVWAMADKVFKWRDKNGNIKVLTADELRWTYNH